VQSLWRRSGLRTRVPDGPIEYEDVPTADWLHDFARERASHVLATNGGGR